MLPETRAEAKVSEIRFTGTPYSILSYPTLFHVKVLSQTHNVDVTAY